MNDKYEFTGEEKVLGGGAVVCRIKAIKDFGLVKAGDIGGWIETEKNLDVSGDAWVYGDALVSGSAWVYGDAQVSGNAKEV